MAVERVRRDQAIDLAKFICSILVVSIHVKPFGEGVTGWKALLNFGIQNYLSRIAVPFFFITSGYFLYRNMSLDSIDVCRVKKYVIKIFRLYLIWSVIYFPLNIKAIIEDAGGIFHGVQKYMVSFVFSGSYSQLWYLNATCFSVCFLTFLLYKKMAPKNILCFSFIVYFIGLFGQSWFGFIMPLKTIWPTFWNVLKMIQSIISTTRNGLFDGMLFLGIGMWIGCYGLKITRKQSIIGFIMSMVLFFIEVFALEFFHISRMHDMYLSLIPVSFFFFSAIQGAKIAHVIPEDLRPISTLVYLSHKGIAKMIAYVCKHTYIHLLETPIYFISVLIITMISSVLIIRMSKTKIVWLKRLYA